MVSTNIKALALKLHSIDEVDRQWILNSLSTDEARKLMNVLNEIKSINLTDNAQIIQESLTHIESWQGQGINNKNDKLSEQIAIVDKIDPEILIPVLAEENTWILAVLLSIHSWRWQESLLKILSPNKKMQIKQYQQKNISKVKQEVKLTLLRILSDLDSVNENSGVMDTEILVNFEEANQDDETIKPKKNKNWWSSLWP